MSINLFAISFILVVRRRILYSSEYSIKVEIKEPEKHKPSLQQENKQNENKLNDQKNSIDDLLQNHQKYLIKGYSLADMAAELNIPQHLLSVIINREYEMSFTNLINKHRIDYIINGVSKHKMASYTFEGIAEEAGFNSRVTFYRAFVKNTGQTPTAYFKNEP
jgi:YesN/AraC family two-component response regulator